MEPKKNIDLEMLIFFLIITIISFVLYISKHPVIIYINQSSINVRALIGAYLWDLFIFLSVLIPYLCALLIAISYTFIKNTHLKSSFFIILFFPLFAFFSKSMFLPQVYINFDLLRIIKDNFAFFIFILLGPFILLFQLVLKKVLKRHYR